MSIRHGPRRSQSAHRLISIGSHRVYPSWYLLQTGMYGQGDVAGLLENEIVNVYGAALADLASLENNLLFTVACLMVLMGEGRIAELEACGVRLSMVDQSIFVRDYPIFGVDPSDRTFRCLGAKDNARLRLRKLVAEIRPELVSRAARILIKAADAIWLWTWPTRSWTAVWCWSLPGSMGPILP